MLKVNVADIRNIALCGHGSAGKTTLIDKFLAHTGAVKGHPTVEDGTSICDFDPEEKTHKYSIEAKLTHFLHGGKRLNCLDTPGYPDFIGQTIGALHGVDTAIVVINAHSGIEVNTRRVFSEAGKLGLARMIVINKMDSDNIEFAELVDSIKEMWGNGCILLNVPVGHGAGFKGVVSTLNPPAKSDGALLDPAEVHTSLIESIVEVDEAMMEKYFEGHMPSPEELSALMRQAIAQGKLTPIVCCAGKTGVGVAELLDDMALCCLSPDVIPRKALKGEEEVELKCDAAGPLVAQVFKTRIDPFVQKLSFIRVFSGHFKKDDTVHSSSSRKGFKAGNVLELQGSETHPIDEASAGDIIALAKIDELHVGTSLGDLAMPKIKFPTPMVGLAVMPKARGDETKLSGALHKLVEEDPTFRIDHDAQTKEIVMTGMSELHLKIIQERLKRRDKLEVDTKDPKIPFRETIMHKAEGSYRHKKQSGGRGQFGEVHIRVYPLPEGTKPELFCTKDRFPSMREYKYDPELNFLWIDSIVGGTIPNNFLPAVEKGFRERIEKGVIAGYRLKNVAVEVFFGKHHPVDSSEAAFKIAGAMALRNVVREARPALLEPVVTLNVTVPSAKLGDISSDMSGRRGRVSGMESAGGDMQTVIAEVPLSEVTTYARSLSSITGGQGSFTMEFSHYEAVPGNVQKQIIDKAGVTHEEEEVEV